MTILRTASLLSVLVLSVAAAARAQIPISFASSNGNASTQTAAYGITPSGGQTNQYLLTTINPVGSLPTTGPSLGTMPANTNVTTLNTYFGLASGTLGAYNAQDGSGYLSQQVTLVIGTVVRFDYIFLTNEDNTNTQPAPNQFHNDRAFFTVNGAINQTIYTANNLSSAQLNASSASPNFNYQSTGAAGNGYTTITYTVPATGNYTFGFGVIDVDSNTVYSGLLIDNFNYSIVPEPGTNALLAVSMGLLGLGLRRRYTRRAGSPVRAA